MLGGEGRPADCSFHLGQTRMKGDTVHTDSLAHTRVWALRLSHQTRDGHSFHPC